MSDASAEFLRLFAMAVLREGEPAILAPRAAEALREVWVKRKSLVLDVRFTGFTSKGQLVGGVDPSVLRAAGHLITLRVTRVGFTPDAGEDDLAALFDAVGKSGAELGADGIVPLLRHASPLGIYLSTSTGGVYRPPAAEPAPGAETPASAEAAPSPAPAGEAPPSAAPAETRPAPAADDDEDEFELSSFELIEDVPELGAPAGSPGTAAPGERPEGQGEVSSNEMFHFFRAVDSQRHEEVETLPRLLAEAENVTRFDELAQSAARVAQRLVRSSAPERALEVLDALVRESQRADRGRLFREAAIQALRRAGTEETLHPLADLLAHGGPERQRVLDLFVFVEGDGVAMLENQLFRTGDAELRREIFGRLQRVQGAGARILARAMSDPSVGRARGLLEAAVLPDVDADVSQRWVAEAAAHADPTVRIDAARHASTLGGRGGLRILLDQLNDADRLVKRAAIQGLGVLGDSAAVPFLARLLGEGADEEMQLAALAALGKIGSAEAIPALLTVINRRSLFGGKKMARAKVAALQALGKIGTAGARDVLQSVAAGKDTDLADEARRMLSLLG